MILKECIINKMCGMLTEIRVFFNPLIRKTENI